MLAQFQQTEKYQELLRVSQAMGVLKWVQLGSFTNFKLAFHPFVSSREYFDYLGNLNLVWNRVLLKVAQDHTFIVNLFTNITENDDLLKGILAIVKKKGPNSLNDGICFDRIDYYNDVSGQPKLTEYNLQCVGMQSNVECFQSAKRLVEGDNSYFHISTIQNFATAMRQIADLKKIEGVVLYVVKGQYQGDSNYLDQGRFEIEIRRQSFKVIRTNLKDMGQKLQLSQNGDLFYAGEKVSIVYNRSIYRLQHYIVGENCDINLSWAAREKVALSNALSIPPIEFQLVNLKRVQTQLGKIEVLRKYATEEQAEMLMKTRVRQWEFDTISEEELQSLIEQVEKNPQGYLLKPNMEGGGNNLFQEQMLNKLKHSSRQQLQTFILMEKIMTKIISNVIIDGRHFQKQDCEYEISRYGTLSWMNGQIVRNQAEGFLVRAKPPSEKEGGIMTGVGAIVTWKLSQ